MSFQPVIPLTGNAGWSFLSRTKAVQEEAFNSSAQLQQKTDYFVENIQGIETASDLVGDRRLLEVALGAFGLADDINNTFFIQKVLTEGTIEDTAFANKLADKRYFELAKAFSFDLSPPNTVLSTFPGKITEAFQTRQFEVAIGNQDENLRLALSLDRELIALKDRDLSETASWFTIMGTPPLRSVFEKALGLPPQIGALDVDRQLEVFRDKALVTFGTSDPTEFTDPERQEDLIRRFLLRADLGNVGASTNSGSVALALLQSNF